MSRRVLRCLVARSGDESDSHKPLGSLREVVEGRGFVHSVAAAVDLCELGRSVLIAVDDGYRGEGDEAVRRGRSAFGDKGVEQKDSLLGAAVDVVVAELGRGFVCSKLRQLPPRPTRRRRRAASCSDLQTSLLHSTLYRRASATSVWISGNAKVRPTSELSATSPANKLGVLMLEQQKNAVYECRAGVSRV